MTRCLSLLPVLFLFIASARAGVDPNRIFFAEGSQKKTFIRDGVVVGGDSAVDHVVIQDLRFANNGGAERLVMDLEGNADGRPLGIERPPYYQIEFTADMRRIVCTVFGKPTLAFDAAKFLAALKKSALISKVELLPVVEKDRWNFVLELKSKVQLEVFELKKPVRIVMDLKK